MGKGTSVIGLEAFMLVFKPSMYAVRAGAPIMQAFIVLAIVMLLPFAIVFSNYSWTMVGIGSLALFTVKFWSYLWFVAKWMEDNMNLALYPDAATFLSKAGAVAGNLTDADYYLKSLVLEIVTGLLYFVLPMAFSMVMAWAGFHAMSAVAALGEAHKQKTEKGGGAAGEAGTRLATGKLGKGGK